MMYRRLLCFCTILLLAFNLCSCGAKVGSDNISRTTEFYSEETESILETETEEESTEPLSSKFEEPSTTLVVAIPKTTEEIIDYYNLCINRVKPEAKTILNTIKQNYLAGSCKIPKWAETVAKPLGGADEFIDETLKKNCSENILLSTHDEIVAYFPVEGETYASKLTASDVSSATCDEKDGIITIKLTTIADEKSSAAVHGKGHAPKAFNVVMPGTINNSVPEWLLNALGGKAEVSYPSATVIVTIEASTGHVLTADYDDKWTINFGDDIVLPFGTHVIFTINW